VTGAAAAQGLAVSFTDTEKVTLLFNVAVFAGTFLLVLLLPRVRRPVTHERERPAGAMLPQEEWRGRDGNDPSGNIAKDAAQRF
jgi:hypothetical protein